MGERPPSTAIDLAASGLNGENHLASRPGKQGLRSAQQARLGPALRGPLCGEGRREGDLNPRGSFWPPTRFPVVLLQPGSDISPNPACVAPRSRGCDHYVVFGEKANERRNPSRSLGPGKRPCVALSKLGSAEREGFEPPVEFPPHLISSQTPSTGLGHLSHPSLLRAPSARLPAPTVPKSFDRCVRAALRKIPGARDRTAPPGRRPRRTADG